jgi:hypothetical protein
MAKIEIVESLFIELEKKFKKESHKILDLLYSLESNPKKGKFIGNVGEIAIKELKYKNFRFYFIVNGHNIKYLGKEELIDLLLRFVRMSNKTNQQEIINEIKHILKTIGPGGF